VTHTCRFCGEEVDTDEARGDPRQVAGILLAHATLYCTGHAPVSGPEPTQVVGDPRDEPFAGQLDLIALPDGTVLQTHGRVDCAGNRCCVHNPSRHHMLAWPQVWYPPLRAILRRCPHDGLHPDPDDLNSRQAGVTHECDGCCLPPSQDAIRDERVGV
jgi:hypothetical protein